MASSQSFTPSFQALINDINATNDDKDNASLLPADSPALRATRLSHESKNPFKVGKVVEHALPQLEFIPLPEVREKWGIPP